MKEYIKKIVDNGNKEDMICLSDMLVDLMYELKENDHDEYKKYKNKIMGMAFNYSIHDELANDIVQDMKPLGEYWTKDTIASVVGNVPNIDEIYVVMNSLVNDYGDIIAKDDVETYKRMTMAWLSDEDGHENKVWWYFVK